MGHTRGQASLELLITVGVVIVFLLPLLVFFSSSTSSKQAELSKTQAKALAQQIADESAQVWYQGSGAKRTVFLNYPKNILNITVSGRQVIVTMRGEGGGQSEIIASAPCNMTDALSVSTGVTDPRMSLAASYYNGEVQPGIVAVVFSNTDEEVNIYRVRGGSYKIA